MLYFRCEDRFLVCIDINFIVSLLDNSIITVILRLWKQSPLQKLQNNSWSVYALTFLLSYYWQWINPGIYLCIFVARTSSSIRRFSLCLPISAFQSQNKSKNVLFTSRLFLFPVFCLLFDKNIRKDALCIVNNISFVVKNTQGNSFIC